MAEAIRFWFRGHLVEVTDVPATTTVLQWLRETRQSLGTKEGCAEGDCGACTVVIGRPDGTDGLELEAAHACLLLLPMLHGRALVTIEDIAPGGGLHPVQSAMVEHQGSQCGYCTPGIVMSLWQMHGAATRDGRALTLDEVRTGLAGHACRCTGYRGIVEAGVAAAADPGTALDVAAVRSALDGVGNDDPLDYRAGATTWVAPVTVEGLVRARADRPTATLVAGGTDLIPPGPGRGELPTDWIAAARVRELGAVTVTPQGLSIGGGATIEDSWAALAALWPQLDVGRRRFASPPVRHQATVAGNLVTASPVGDTAPVLLALGARVALVGVRGERLLDMDELVTGYRVTALEPDEILLRIDVPAEVLSWDVRMAKVARRFDNDIATVSLAAAVHLDDAGVVDGVRVALGGVAPTPLRARAVEAALAGRAWDRAALTLAQEAVAADCAPMSDHRGSADYRIAAARGLLERWWLQTRPVDPLPIAATEVWGAS